MRVCTPNWIFSKELFAEMSLPMQAPYVYVRFQNVFQVIFGNLFGRLRRKIMTKITPLCFGKLKLLFGTCSRHRFPECKSPCWASVTKRTVRIFCKLCCCVFCFPENTWQRNHDENYVARFSETEFLYWGLFLAPDFYVQKLYTKHVFQKKLRSSPVELAAACFVYIKR